MADLPKTSGPQQEAALCTVCPRYCGLFPAENGVCGLRCNIDGMVMPVTPAWQPFSAASSEHFFSGNFASGSLFLAATLKDSPQDGNNGMTAAALADFARSYDTGGAAISGVVFAGRDPFFLPEYIIDAAKMLRREHLKVAAVTAACGNAKIARSLASCLDACVIKLDGFPSELNGDFETVYNTIAALYEKNVYIEISITVKNVADASGSSSSSFARSISIIDPDIPIFITTEKA